MDAEISSDGGIAALMPDGVAPTQIADALRIDVDDLRIAPAVGRDAGSVWVLRSRSLSIGRLRIAPAHLDADPSALRLVEAAAFGTGLHPTTALCVEALERALEHGTPDAVLDVGTGSGILAIAALMMGVPRATGIDLDDEALRVAAENGRINAVGDRLQLIRGGPDVLSGAWPLVLANVLPGPLIEMAPTLVRRIAHRGEVVLSGISSSVEHDVEQAYRRLGMRRRRVTSRAGWIALEMQASW